MALTVQAAPPAERDWAATLRTDSQVLHDDIAANHPGPVNAEDPGFARRNDAQLRIALERAGTVSSLSGYYQALQAYVASFDDGHLDLDLFGATQSETNWPGFLTRYGADDEQRVASLMGDSPVPYGARLVSCDGRPAFRLAQEYVGPFVGRWSLLSQRLSHGGALFADRGNPYVVRPSRCTFDVNGRNQEVTLAWRPIAAGELASRLRQLRSSRPREVAARTLADGTRWVSIASFDGSPESAAGRALPPLIAALRAERAALAAAPAIVLDLRGNGGGSSDWSRQIANILWGPGQAGHLPRGTARVDWRASAANLAWMRISRDQRVAGGVLSPHMRRWYDRVIAGLEGAIARGEPLWRQTDDAEESAGASTGPGPEQPALGGPVFVVTDATCASACLDAVEMWRAMGAVHVGQTTSADTLYMDIRVADLPSGLGRYVVPMKVYRGRPRGSNQPIAPVHMFTRDIGDTQTLEYWISTLPARRR